MDFIANDCPNTLLSRNEIILDISKEIIIYVLLVSSEFNIKRRSRMRMKRSTEKWIKPSPNRILSIWVFKITQKSLFPASEMKTKLKLIRAFICEQEQDIQIGKYEMIWLLNPQNFEILKMERDWFASQFGLHRLISNTDEV